jgi:hypothetical protein
MRAAERGDDERSLRVDAARPPSVVETVGQATGMVLA